MTASCENIYYNSSNKDKNNLSYILKWIMRHRLFVVISTALSLVIAFAYLYYTPKQWSRTSQITMKYDAKGQPTTSDVLVFSNIGLLNSGISFSNEKHLVNSYVVWDVIVDELHLNYNYRHINALRRKKPLYKDSPIEVILPADIERSGIDRLSFKINRNGNSLKISDFNADGEYDGTDDIVTETGKPAKTPIGEIILIETPHYKNWESGAIEFSYTAKPIYIPMMQSSIRQAETDQFSTVIETNYTDYSPERAADILNHIPIAYTKVWNRQKDENAAISKASIEVLLDSVAGKMRSTERQITQLLKTNGITTPELETARHYQETSSFQSDALQSSIADEIAVFLINKLNSFKSGNYEMLPLDNSIDSLAIRQQIIRYNEQVLELIALSGSYDSDNPAIQTRKKQLSLQKDNILGSLSHFREQLAIKQQTAEQRYNKMIAAIPGLSEIEKQWVVLQRKLKAEEETMVYLLNKREECDIAEKIELSPVRIIMPAYGNDAPVWPQPSTIILIAAIIGLIAIPVSAAAVDNLLNYNVKEMSDFNNYSFSVIGQIPQIGRITIKERFCNLLHIEAKADKTPKLLIQKDSLFTESIRQMRNNFARITQNEAKTPITILTSFNPGSGKTFFLLNLVASIAASGKKVLIIDADIRRASMSEYVGKPRVGLTSYLNGAGTIESIILKNRIVTGLDIIPSGKIPTDPTELLQNGKIDEIVDTLKSQYDYIFLDAPPINIIADTLEISRVANHTLFVIRRGMLDRRMLPELERIYRQGTYPGLYVIFNGSTPPYSKKAIRSIFRQRKRV